MRVTYTSVSHCSIGIWTGDETTILHLSDFARQAGLAPGDTVKRIGSVVNPTVEDIVSQIRNRGPDDTIDITVERVSEDIVITANCEDGLAASVELNAAFDAASQGRWADCIFRGHKYEQEIGYVSSGPAGLRFVCNECSRIGDQRFDAAGAIWFRALSGLAPASVAHRITEPFPSTVSSAWFRSPRLAFYHFRSGPDISG